MFRFKIVKKRFFLQSFNIRSLLSGVNDNPPLKTSWFSYHEVLFVDSKVLSYSYLTSMFLKTFAVELNLLFNFLFGAFLLLLSICACSLRRMHSWRRGYTRRSCLPLARYLIDGLRGCGCNNLPLRCSENFTKKCHFLPF